MAEDRIVSPLEIITREQLEALEAAGWEISRPLEFEDDEAALIDGAERAD